MKVIPFNIDKAGLEKLIADMQSYAWFFEWGMFIFLLVALAATAWVFIDSSQKKKGPKSLAPRLLSIIGVLMVIPAFLFRFTGTTDGTTLVVKLYGDALYKEPISYNVKWLVNGYGPKIAIIAMLGTSLAVLAAIIYASTVSRQRPSTEFVGALNQQFGELRQEIQSVKTRPTPTAAAAPTSAAAPAAPAGGRGAPTVISQQPSRRSAPTIIDQAGQSFAELRVISGKATGQRWELSVSDAKIGRETDNLVSVDDDKWSREHAKIKVADGEYTLIDLGSSNGTYVNDRKVEGAVRLNDGDTVRIGDTVMAFKSVKTQ